MPHTWTSRRIACGRRSNLPVPIIRFLRLRESPRTLSRSAQLLHLRRGPTAPWCDARRVVRIHLDSGRIRITGSMPTAREHSSCNSIPGLPRYRSATILRCRPLTRRLGQSTRTTGGHLLSRPRLPGLRRCKYRMSVGLPCPAARLRKFPALAMPQSPSRLSAQQPHGQAHFSFTMAARVVQRFSMFWTM